MTTILAAQTEDAAATDFQFNELARLVKEPYLKFGLTRKEWDELRQDEGHKALIHAHYLYMERLAVRRNPLGFSLPLDTLEGLRHAPANTSLFYSTADRLSRDDRYDRVTDFFRRHANVSSFELVETGPQDVPGWLDLLVVSPVDLARYLGYDIFGIESQHAAAYCTMARPLTVEIPGISKGDYLRGCLKDDGSRLKKATADLWGQVPHQQESKQPLKIRLVSGNPATWWGYDGTQYAVAPMHVQDLCARLPVGSPIKSGICADLVAYASVAVAETWMTEQIAAGTGPRNDIVGTELRGGGEFSRCPRCGRCDVRAWLYGDGGAGCAGGSFGAVVFARE